MIKRKYNKLFTLVWCCFFVHASNADNILPESQLPILATGDWRALNNGKALTPPMGWASWNAFHLDINQDKIYGIADAMVDKGFNRAGYQYVNIDDGWWSHRQVSDNHLVINTERFPAAKISDAGVNVTSFKPLTDYMHDRGLKAGIYSDTGRNSCAQLWDISDPNLPVGTALEKEVGSFDHTSADINLFFNEWGFDYLKLDSCGIRQYTAENFKLRNVQGIYQPFTPFNEQQVKQRYQQVMKSMMTTSNPGLLSVCIWGEAGTNHWGAETGNVWRTSGDIRPTWKSMLKNYNSAVERELYAGPGRWNDPDMLYIGKGEFDAKNLEQAKAHMSLWAMMSSPLIMGADIRNTPDIINDIMKNNEIISINQDVAGHQATRVYQDEQAEILVKTLGNQQSKFTSKVALLLNKTSSPKAITITAEQVNFASNSQVETWDVWQQKSLRSFSNELTLTVPPYGVRVLTLSGQHALGSKRYLGELPGLVHVARQFKHSAKVNKATNGALLTNRGKVYAHGIGVSANSLLQVKLDGKYKRFQALSAVDDSVGLGNGLIHFSVYGDGHLLWQSQLLKAGDMPSLVDVDLSGISVLELVAQGRDEDNFSHANWFEPILTK